MSRLIALCCRMLFLASALIFGLGLAMACLRFPGILYLLLGAFAWRKYRSGGLSVGTSHGSARLSGYADLMRAGMLGDDGLLFGTTAFLAKPGLPWAVRVLLSPLVDSTTACRYFLASLGFRTSRQLIRLGTYVHLAAFAPTGRGKGVSLLIPNLMSYPHSCVITDPKGELYDITSEVRRRRHRNRIVVFDPYFRCGPGTATLNPLDFCDHRAPDFPEQVRAVASAIVIRAEGEKEPHWNDRAEAVICAFVAYVCVFETNPLKRNLQTVRELLVNVDAFTEAIEEMKKGVGCDGVAGLIARMGNALGWLRDRELGSVLSSVDRHMRFLDTAAIYDNTITSSFNPRDLREGRVTVYLVLPEAYMTEMAAVMRLWITTILLVTTRGKPTERNPVTYFLDEIAHLGHIRELENAVTLKRGSGVRLWFFFQSIGQLKKCFGEHAQTFLDNIDTQLFFGTNAYASADHISKRVGDCTIITEHLSRTRNRSWQLGFSKDQGVNVSEGVSRSYQPFGRPVFRPDEILRLPDDVGLLFHRNLPVIPIQMIKYFDSPEFNLDGKVESPGVGFAACFLAVAALVLSQLFAALVVSEIPVPVPSLAPPQLRPRANWTDGEWSQPSPAIDPGGFSMPAGMSDQGNPPPMPWRDPRRLQPYVPYEYGRGGGYYR